MRRRDLIAGAALAIGAGSAAAQVSAKRHRIAVAGGLLPAAWRDLPLWHAFFGELRRLGYVEGGNLTVEAFSGKGQSSHYTDLAYDVADHRPELIVCDGSPIASAFKLTVPATPIVAVMFNPLDWQLVPSLAHPGGYLTGVSIDPGASIWMKRLQIVKGLVPSASRVACLCTTQVVSGFLRHFQFGAREKLGIELSGMVLPEATPQAIEDAFARLPQPRPNAILLSPELELAALGRQIAALAVQTRLPAMYPYGEYVEAGGLIAYSPDLSEVGRQLADDAAQVLGGAKPGDIPVYEPTKFRLLINLRTAGALGITIPPAMLAQADKVIE